MGPSSPSTAGAGRRLWSRTSPRTILVRKDRARLAAGGRAAARVNGGTMPQQRRAVTAVVVLTMVAILAAMLIAAGCGGTDEGDGGAVANPSPTGTPEYGGSLTIVFQSEAETLDPAIAWELTGTSIEQSVYQGLIRYKSLPGMEGTVLEPSIATEVPEPTNDGKTYTFTIRQGVNFHPPVSRQVTAADVKYSFERMMSLPLAPATYFYIGVVGPRSSRRARPTRSPGSRSSTTRPCSSISSSPTPPSSTRTRCGSATWCPRNGSRSGGTPTSRAIPSAPGRSSSTSWKPGREVVLTKNPDYWEEGKPYLDGLKFQFSMTPSTAFLKLQNGEVDVLGDNIPPAEIPRVMADPELKKQVASTQLIAGTYLTMNTQFEPFDNVEVRRALSWAIDREKLCKLQSGQADPLWQFYPEGMPGSVAGKRSYGYDVEKAKRLLADAGYPDGFETVFYSHNVDPFPKIAQSIQADLKRSASTPRSSSWTATPSTASSRRRTRRR